MVDVSHYNFDLVSGVLLRYNVLHCLIVFNLFVNSSKGREAQLNEAKEKNRVLEQALQALAAEHHDLERSITFHSSPTMPVQPAAGVT